MNNSNMSDAGDKGAHFILYTGQERADIPRYVIHVRVHPSVRVIEGGGFKISSQLAIAVLGKGVERGHLAIAHHYAKL